MGKSVSSSEIFKQMLDSHSQRPRKDKIVGWTDGPLKDPWTPLFLNLCLPTEVDRLGSLAWRQETVKKMRQTEVAPVGQRGRNGCEGHG